MQKMAVHAESTRVKGKTLWGKNFPLNSEIRFEYYLDGIHASYPDFILKDDKGRIHLFEVKSLNKSAGSVIDTAEYEAKVRALKACYRQCSKLTGYVFYLPILKGNEWQVSVFDDGEEATLTTDRLLESFV